MDFTPDEIISFFAIINGFYIIASKQTLGVGWEGFEPSFYLKRRGTVVVGIVSVLIGLSINIFSKIGYPLFGN